MSGFDLTATANVLLERLGAASFGDLDWCSEGEVWGWFYEAQGRLSELGLFVTNESVETVAMQGSYALPAGWLNTIFASVNGQQLRPVSAAELQAFDSSWAGAQCGSAQVPSRYSMDAGPLGTVTFYPKPSRADAVELVDQIVPSQILQTQTTAPINALMQDYFLYFALARARGKESPNAMPEVADAAMQMVQMMEQIFVTYWVKP